MIAKLKGLPATLGSIPSKFREMRKDDQLFGGGMAATVLGMLIALTGLSFLGVVMGVVMSCLGANVMWYANGIKVGRRDGWQEGFDECSEIHWNYLRMLAKETEDA